MLTLVSIHLLLNGTQSWEAAPSSPSIHFGTLTMMEVPLSLISLPSEDGLSQILSNMLALPQSAVLLLIRTGILKKKGIQNQNHFDFDENILIYILP